MRLLTFYLLLLLLLLLPVQEFGKVLKSKDYEYKLKKAENILQKRNIKMPNSLYIELFPGF